MMAQMVMKMTMIIGGGGMVTKVATLVVQGANWRVQSKSRRC